MAYYYLFIYTAFGAGPLLAQGVGPQLPLPWAEVAGENAVVAEARQDLSAGSEAAGLIRLNNAMKSIRKPGGVPQLAEWFELALGLKKYLQDPRLRKEFIKVVDTEAAIAFDNTLENASEDELEKILNLFHSTELARAAAIRLARIYIEENPLRAAHYFDELVTMAGYPEEVGTADLYRQAFAYSLVNDRLGMERVIKVIEARGKPALVAGATRYHFDDFVNAIRATLEGQDLKPQSAGFEIKRDNVFDDFKLCDDGKILSYEPASLRLQWYQYGQLIMTRTLATNVRSHNDVTVRLQKNCEVIFASRSGEVGRISEMQGEVWRREPMPDAMLTSWQTDTRQVEAIPPTYVVLKAGREGTMLFLNYENGDTLWSLSDTKFSSYPRTYATGDGQVLIDSDETLFWYDSRGQAVRSEKKKSWGQSVVTSSSDMFFVCHDDTYFAYRDGKLIWQKKSEEVLARFAAPQMAATLSSKHLYVIDYFRLAILDAQTGDSISNYPDVGFATELLAWGTDGMVLASYTLRANVYWNAKHTSALLFSDAEKDLHGGHIDYRFAVSVSENGVVSGAVSRFSIEQKLLTDASDLYYTPGSDGFFAYHGRFPVHTSQQMLTGAQAPVDLKSFFPKERRALEINTD